MTALTGCRLGTSEIVCPLSYPEQKTAIMEIAPLGTPRDETVKKLAEAGIEGSFGIRNSVYYCDFWQREEDQRWHLDLALLFDQTGRLYQIRPAQFLVDSSSEAVSISASVTADSEKPDVSRRGRQRNGSFPEAAATSLAHPPSPASDNSVRSGRRTPFAQTETRPP